MTIDDTQFQTDDAKMLADAAKVQADLAALNDPTTGAIATYKKKLADLKNADPMQALMLLFYILGASGQDSTTLGIWSDQSGITGDRLALNGDVTAVGNDLNKMTNSNDSDPNSLNIFGQDADKFLDQLSGTGHYADPNMAPNTQDPSKSSMDPEAEQSVYNQLLGIRQLFKITDPVDPNYNPPTGATYYFDPTDSNKIQSFQQFQTDLGLQGDVQGSTDAAKIITDNFGTNTQTTQTASAVMNNDQKTYTSLMQSTQSFLAAIAQWWNGIVKGTTSHMLTS